MSTIEQCRGRHHVPDKDARVVRRERSAGQIRAGQRDIDGGARIAGIRGEGGDRRRTDATGVPSDRQQIADGIVRIRRDMALPVDHLRQPAQVVIAILRLIGGRRHWLQQCEAERHHEETPKPLCKKHRHHIAIHSVIHEVSGGLCCCMG